MNTVSSYVTDSVIIFNCNDIVMYGIMRINDIILLPWQSIPSPTVAYLSGSLLSNSRCASRDPTQSGTHETLVKQTRYKQLLKIHHFNETTFQATP